MKIQDLIFFIILIGVTAYKKPVYVVSLGLICITLAIPLFSKWIFFTAERLTWYAASCFGIFISYSLLQRKDSI